MKHLLENQINGVQSKQKRKDNAKSRLRIDEQWGQDLVSLVDEWKCNTFDPENQNLRTLQTATYIYEDSDVLAQHSVNTWLISKSKSLFDPYPRTTRKRT